MSDRTPPHDKTAERAVIGAALLNAQALVRAQAILEPQHFYINGHRRIWGALGRMHARGEGLDPVTLGAELAATGELERVGGQVALGSFTDEVATLGNIDHYSRIVLGLAARRALIHAGQRIIDDGYAVGIDIDHAIDAARSAVTGAAKELHAEGDAVPLSRSVQTLFKQLETREANPDLIPVGIGGIKLARGIPAILAARPSNGKSVTAMNMALNVAAAGFKVLVFSLEDVERVWTSRAMARFSGVPLDAIIEREMDIDHWPRVVDAASKLGTLNIGILDRTNVSSSWIRQTAAAYQDQNGLDFVIVDYAQLIRDRGESRQDGLAEGMRGLGTMTRELHVAGLILSQIRRPEGGFKGKVPPPPTLHMLKGSGVLEEVAKDVVLLHWPHFYDKEQPEDALWCNLAKRSNGPPGRRSLQCAMPRMWVGDPGLNQADSSGDRY